MLAAGILAGVTLLIKETSAPIVILPLAYLGKSSNAIDEATRRHTEIIVMGAPRAGRRRGVFSDTVDFVLKHAPCRVMVAAGRKAA